MSESGLWFVAALSLVALCEVLLYCYFIFVCFSKSVGSGSTQLSWRQPRSRLAPHLKFLRLSFSFPPCRAGIILSSHVTDVLREISPKHTVGSCRRGDLQPALAKHPCFKTDFRAREQTRISTSAHLPSPTLLRFVVLMCSRSW